MALVPKTVITYPLEGTNRDFLIPFEYLARKFVQVTLIGQDRKLLILNTDYRFTQRTIVTLTVPWGPSAGYERVEIRRYTSATERLVDFSDGSILRAYDLNTSQIQSLHIAEEGRDVASDTIGVNNDGNLDARGRRIVNVADGVDPGDAINVRMLMNWDQSALNSANLAQKWAQNPEGVPVIPGQYSAYAWAKNSEFNAVRAEQSHVGATGAYQAARAAQAAAEQAAQSSAQEAQSAISMRSRALRVAPDEPILPEIPRVPQRANKILSFDASGYPSVTVPVNASAQDLQIKLADHLTTGLGPEMVALRGGGSLYDLQDTLSPLRGAAHVGRAVRHIANLAELKGVPGKYKNECIYLMGRSTVNDFPGVHMWDPASTLPESLYVVQVSGIATGRWLRLGAEIKASQRVSILDFIPQTEWAAIASGQSEYDCSDALDMANTLGVALYCPKGTYRVTRPLRVKVDGAGIEGAGRRQTTFYYVGTEPFITNPTGSTVTRLFNTFKGFMLNTPNTVLSINAQGFQFGVWSDLWVYASGKPGCVGIELYGNWGITEATYNHFERFYIGNTLDAGFRIRDGANTNVFMSGRVQPSGGSAFVLASLTGTGRCQNNTIIGVGMEYPGQVSIGVNVGAGVEDTVVIGCRFEYLNCAISDAGLRTKAEYFSNYFDGCRVRKYEANPINASPEAWGSAFVDVSNLFTVRVARNVVVDYVGVGVFNVTYKVAPDIIPVPVVSSSCHITRVSDVTINGFSIRTDNLAGGSLVPTNPSALTLTINA